MKVVFFDWKILEWQEFNSLGLPVLLLQRDFKDNQG